MELREMIIEDEDENGVYAISLVASPATEEEFVMLSKQTPVDVKMAEVSADEQLLLGLVLQPNQKIYRKDEKSGEEYEIYFSEQTIKKAAQLYLMDGNQHNVTFEHEAKIKDVSMVESWIISDSKKDKSAAYGKEYPVGSWMAVMKVHNKDMWEEFKANGIIKGFSLEGMFTPKVKNIALSSMDRLKYLKSIV